MKNRYSLSCAALVLAGGLQVAAVQAGAQDNPGNAAQAEIDSQRRAAEQPRRLEAEERLRREEERRAVENEAVSMEEEMRIAEARLEEAARRIAELSMRQLPDMNREEFAFAFGGRPVIGVTIEAGSGDGPVAGVELRGVTPGGAAFDAGLRAGDVLTAVNGESLAADSSAAANRRLLEFMDGVDEGDRLTIEYLRSGKVGSVELEPRPGPALRYGFAMPPGEPAAPHAAVAPVAPVAPGPQEFLFRRGGGWGDLEMVPLTAGLGRYFGTDKGLLVVRAPADGKLELEDGDVIQSIDGREPASIGHAVRILGSYLPGEIMKLEIVRDKRRRTLEIEIPDDRRGAAFGPVPDARADVVVNVRRRVERN